MKKHHRVYLTVDAVIFGYDSAGGVSILLIKRKSEPFQGNWAFPGGFVEENESLEAAVNRELKEETGIEVSHLEQFYTFGEPFRDPRKRVVTIAHYGLVRPKEHILNASDDADDAQWFTLKHLPKLAFDHNEILNMALLNLKNKISCKSTELKVLTNKFQSLEIVKLLEILCGRINLK